MAAKGNYNVLSDWPKWKIALLVGTPVAVGAVGLWYYNRRRSGNQNSGQGTASKEPVVKDEGKVEPTQLEKAQAAKNKGNKYFKGGKYDQAIVCYSEAIEICPKENKGDMAIFYQNRAAAFEQLKKYNNVNADCTKALELDPKYTKALFRRAKACEVTGDLMQSLEDVTACCILESFQNPNTLMMAERVLKELGRTKAEAAYKNRQPVAPSKQFIRTYFSTFRNDPVINAALGHNRDKDGDVASEPEKDRDETPEKEQAQQDKGAGKDVKPSPYKQALESVRTKEYGDILSLCTSEIEQESSSHLPESLLLRGTFHLLYGVGQKAAQDFDRLLNLENVDKAVRSNALIKRGSLRLQNGQQTEALDDFATASREDPSNSDIYHHRGQLNLLIDRVEDAVKDFEKSVSLSPDFAIAHVQKCYTEYRLAFASRSPMQLQAAMKSFDEALERFKECAEGFALYGQALCDQQMFDKADENFQKALELEPDSGNIYVHKGLLRLQWKQNIDEAAKLVNKALEVDDQCEFAYETLGTIEVQRGNLDRAIELFHKALQLAKTEMEMAHLYSLLDAAIAQSRVAQNFGISVPLAGMGMA